MKTVSAFVPRGLAALSAAAMATLVGCTGTPVDEPTAVEIGETPAPAIESTSAEDFAPAPGAASPVTPAQDPQDPQDPEQVAQQRSQFLVSRSIEEARRALELRLWADAARIAGQVLEIDPSNQDARQILVDARAALGLGGANQAFSDRVHEAQVAQQKTFFDVRREVTLGDAEMEQGKFGDAVQHYERAALLLEFSPFLQPGSAELANIRAKLEAARQAQVQAQAAEDQALAAASQAEVEAEERKLAIQRATRVKSLMEDANLDFQIGNYDRAVRLLDQALMEDPNNANALELRALAGRARHENRMDLLRQDWKAEWARTFDDLNTMDVPQTDPVVYDLERWREVSKRQPLQFTPPEDLESPEEKAIRAKLDSTRIEHRFTSAAVRDWADYYARVTDVTFVVTTEVTELDEDATTLTDFQLPAMSVTRALDVIGNVTGVRWKVENGVVKLVTPENAGGRRYLVQYEVRDITQGVQDRPGPELKLKSPGDEDSLDDDLEVPESTVVTEDKLDSLIRDNIATESWDDEGGASVSIQRGVLLVRHDREVHQQIEQLLSDLRQAVGIQVDVETRFLQVEDSFLEDIGVDFRGLGDQSSEGLAGRGLERNNRNNAGFDDYGDRSFINSATPGEIGTGTEPGVFFDDGQDGDLMARTENLFDRTLGEGSNLDNGGGLSVQYAYLDDTELQVVLRAVEKQERSEIITAPRLLIYNNTRASMSVLRHTSYIRDFDVEIAQAAAVANPIVDVVRDGVVLDVRPVVSADRRFITMELRPTVMTLDLPIPTFTTTLGVGQPVQIQLPSVTLQRVRTTVTMPDGGTLMLGGMKLTQKQNQVSGVPILKNIPLLSFLFSRKGTFTQNRKILILIRAKVIIPDEHVPELGPDDFTANLLSK